MDAAAALIRYSVNATSGCTAIPRRNGRRGRFDTILVILMSTSVRVVAAAVGVAFLLHAAASPLQRKKKNERDFTQTLEALPDPPAALAAETARLSFVPAPLSTKGLLSQQARDAIRFLINASRGAQFIQIRAFVAGTGDLRRIQSLVSELFAEKRLSLPVLSVVQVGALPLEGAQVQMEAVLQDRKPANPAGLVFAAASATTPRAALEQLQATLHSAGADPAPLRLTCAVSSSDWLQTAREASSAVFPSAPLLVHQAQRIPAHTGASCTAVARLSAPIASGVRFLPGAAAVSAPKLVFTGAQLAFRYQEADARLAFQRLERTLQSASSSLRRCVFLNVYPLSPQIAGLAAKVRAGFVNAEQPPAGATFPYEGLPALDAAFALEAIALPNGGS